MMMRAMRVVELSRRLEMCYEGYWNNDWLE